MDSQWVPHISRNSLRLRRQRFVGVCELAYYVLVAVQDPHIGALPMKQRATTAVHRCGRNLELASVTPVHA